MCFHFYRMRQWIDEADTHIPKGNELMTHTYKHTHKQIHVLVTSLSCRSCSSARVLTRGDWFDRPCSGIPKSPFLELHEFSPILVSTADIHAVAIFAQVACINIFEAGLGDCFLMQIVRVCALLVSVLGNEDFWSKINDESMADVMKHSPGFRQMLQTMFILTPS